MYLKRFGGVFRQTSSEPATNRHPAHTARPFTVTRLIGVSDLDKYPEAGKCQTANQARNRKLGGYRREEGRRVSAAATRATATATISRSEEPPPIQSVRCVVF